MSLPVLIYLAEICGNLACGLGILVFGFTLVTAFAALYSIIELDNRERDYQMTREVFWGKAWKRTLLPLCIFMFLGVIVPSKQTIYLMAGAKYSTEIAQSAEAKEVGSKILKVLNQKLDEMGGKK